MNIASYAKKRYTTKAFDPARKVPEETIAQLRELIRFSPSSVNSQPWHFVVASSDEAKARVAKAAQGRFAYNEPKIRDASHVFVLCTRAAMDDAHLAGLLSQEDDDRRFVNADARKGQQTARQSYVDVHRYELKDAQHWMEKQVYLALGTLLLGASTLDVDACPMEGFDAKALDEELGLRQKGFTSAVIVGLGYSGEGDFNKALPKSRLPAEVVFTDL
ncbi:oxygen-insensitive NAD(P)H nitroreductase [Burkholderia sp. WAC0059]|uniref:oxygen-insensitive NAD(P)H nitroreductase n=1 Tax=Burkholderia sp. WAC0059 TaxID=2066022 RepID=UPI000C7EB781|nr:oxygen-insensitive NAD(P)H nitroreductase [Burkholderia sp. WAC0059]PLZ02799.1 oxygen-insensitive NAD(P)H nitroreductase [Burkholderia sp. WAC0059]